MNWLTAAERLAALDRSNVRLDSSRCLHTIDRFSDCQACSCSCPVGALQASSPPILDGKSCTRCLACLPVCPTGALQADDPLRSMLNCVPRLPAGGVELVCAKQAAPKPAFPDSGVILRVRSCLAGISPGMLVTMVAAEAIPLRLRIDACSACAWKDLERQTIRQVQAARQFLEPWGMSDAVTCSNSTIQDSLSTIPVWDADNPPLSRRDLFRVGTRHGSLALARVMNAEGETVAQIAPPRERRRLLGAAAHLPTRKNTGGNVPLVDLQVAWSSVSPQCTACGVCARACPTGALRYDRDEDQKRFRLSFHIESCTDCKVCIHSCAEGAIQLHTSPTFDQVFSQPGPVVLLEGGLKRCQRCNAWISAELPASLCPLCAYRKKHPFGSSRPPGIETGAKSAEKGQGS